MDKKRIRKKISSKVKFQAVMELIKREKPAVEVARSWGLHVKTLRNWHKEFMKKGFEIFEGTAAVKEYEEKIEELEKIIGQQTIEIALLKKFLGGWELVSRKRLSG